MDDKQGAVLHAISSGGMYGIERALAALLPALQGAGCKVALLSLEARESEGGAVGRALEDLGVPVHYVPMRRGMHPADLLTLSSLVARLRPRAVHVHGYKATLTVGAVAWLRRVPVIATMHSEVASAVPELRRVIAVESRLLNRVRGVVAVSNGVANDLVRRGIDVNRIAVIRNGIDDIGGEAGGSRRTNQDFRAVVIGRLVESKNVHVAIESVSQLARDGAQIQLEIIGDGPEDASLRALARRLDVEQQVEFSGFVEDVSQRLRRASLFLMPSRSEGIPISLLEAMAMGTPVIASNVGGIPEVVSHNVEALLIEPDRPVALTEAISRVLADPALSVRLASAARERYLREFRSQTMRDRYLALYAKLGV